MGCADICLSMDYDATNEFYAEKVVTARKPHKCCECGDVIATGTQYERASGKADGAIFTAHSCLPCREIRRAFCCGGWVFEELWESVREELFPVWKKSGPWDCLAKLDTEDARAKINAEYREWNQDSDDATPTGTGEG